jgi:hypothetical protein
VATVNQTDTASGTGRMFTRTDDGNELGAVKYLHETAASIL